jgi:quercetin dioxygenase-like cupin family protein
MKIACGLGLAVLIALVSPSRADVLGRSIAYPSGTPAIRAYRITVPPRKATILHQHPVPLYAYILSGTLEVDYGVRGRKTYTAGQNFLEAVDWCHAGRAVGDVPVVLISVYIGADKTKNTVACPK